jgi:predicted nuclease of predicted toxin-antitoxin system
MIPSSPQRELWLDAHLSKYLSKWIEQEFGVRCRHLLGLGLREMEDEEIFEAARAANAVVVTKDSDFVRLVRERGFPPRIIHLVCGNATNRQLQSILAQSLGRALDEFRGGAMIIEVDWPH